MAVSAIVLSQLTVELDRQWGVEWLTNSWWTSLNQPDGARSLLATVAGSMITVAGVTFSLTILAVSHATSHFGPRLLDNFMRDRGNQVTLGTFVATFLYCLLVLRTIRSAAGSEMPDQFAELFVPHFSVLVAVVLALSSVGVLIYFIHHVPESIHIYNVLDRISSQLRQKVEELYPESSGEPMEPANGEMPDKSPTTEIEIATTGYLQGIDVESLIESAKQRDTIIELLVRPGDFLLLGQKVVRVYGVCDDDAKAGVLSAFAIGVSRTPTQDLFFILNQFTEIAIRALSPGVNDPFTAIQCIDQLADGLVRLSSRELPARYRVDADGDLRLITTKPTWDAIVSCAIDCIVPYVQEDRNVTLYLDQTIDRICCISDNQILNRLLVGVQNDLKRER